VLIREVKSPMDASTKWLERGEPASQRKFALGEASGRPHKSGKNLLKRSADRQCLRVIMSLCVCSPSVHTRQPGAQGQADVLGLRSWRYASWPMDEGCHLPGDLLRPCPVADPKGHILGSENGSEIEKKRAEAWAGQVQFADPVLGPGPH
jgi:hypothetical protein